MATYSGKPNYRGWLAADPNKQWALDFVGNDYEGANAGINMDAIKSLSEGAGAVVGPSVPGGSIPYQNVEGILRGYASQYGQNVLGASTTTPGGAGSKGGSKTAADAARSAALRTNITDLVNTTKSIFNERYGLVDDALKEQTNKLNKRFGDESADVTRQVVDQSNQAGGAFAARGTRDSSDYGNTVDTIKAAGEKQVRDLGTDLEDNLAKVGQWASDKKTKFDAEKSGLDTIVSRLAESTDPDELSDIRNQIDAKITELRGDAAEYNTNAKNRSALESIAPSGQRAQQLTTTLQSILGSSANPNLKRTIAERLVGAAGLNADDANRLLQQFSGEVDKQEQQ